VSFWEKKRVVVTGGAGFLGSYVREGLARRGLRDPIVPRSSAYDLVEKEAVVRLYEDARPDLVIHLAAKVGGIGANRENPGRYFYENLMMGAHVLHQAYVAKVPKVVLVGTICAYPKFAPVPFREEDLWNGYPEETNAPYGVAKKSLAVMSQAYRDQYGTSSVFLLPVNLYGPRDNFDPGSSHVIPALIKKCVDANRTGAAEIVIWGDGSPTREFIHAEDAAEGILLAAERYDSSDPVNIGAGFEISIKELADLIVKETGFRGNVVWDPTKPNGQPRRRLDVSKAEKLFGFRAKKDFALGIRETVAWYVAQSQSGGGSAGPK
jgi:GDP-L-fucose synthase